MTYDVAVVGGGVVGAMIVRELSKYDLSVCLLEKESDVACGATKANSGIVHAGFDAEHGSLKAILNVQGAKLFPEIAEELDVKYEVNGSLVVAFDEDELEKIERLYDNGIANGVEGLEIISKEQVLELEPNISDDVLGALYALTGAICCPYKLAIAAVANAMDNDVELRLGFEVNDIRENDGVFEISSATETIKTKYIINAAGVFADKIAKMVGDNSFEIVPRKGEYILLDKCDFVTATVFRVPTEKGKGILVSPTVDGNVLLGPTSHYIDDKDDTATTLDGQREIRAAAVREFPNMPINNVIASFSGIRASTTRGDFIIELNGNLVNVAGIDSPGLSAAPAIANYVVNLLKDAGVSLSKKADFKRGKPQSVIDKSKYQRIICRCENISEADIVEAIRANPTAQTVDAIKRRTRCTMGRCQGGFCSPYLITILARELGVSVEEVTKNGGNSNYIVGQR